MENPLQKLIPKDTETGSDPNGIRGRVKMNKEADKALHPESTSAPATNVAKPAGPFKVDKVTGRAPYGSKPGEKPPEAMPWLERNDQTLGKMHSGGTVPKTGPYVIKAGEKVLTTGDHSHLKNAMSLASVLLTRHDAEKDQQPAMPMHLKELHIKQLHTGGFHVQKHDGKGGMTEHGAPDNDSVIEHFMDHMAHPDEDEEAVEAGDHDMNGTEAQEHALGYK